MTHRDIEMEVIENFVKNNKPKIVLEIGPGLESFEKIFNAEEYYSIDNQSQYHSNALKMDAHKLEFSEDFFDCIFMSHVAEHFLNPVKAFKEILRTLKTGGKLLSITPNCCEHQIIKGDPDHIFVLNNIQWIRLLNNVGFKNIKSYVQMTSNGGMISDIQNYNIITIAQK